MPKDIQSTFSDDQLTHLKVAIGARQWGKHGFDSRGVFKAFKYRYYFVFLVGRNRRELSAKEQKSAVYFQAVITSIFVFLCALFLLLTLYLVKSALGIDILESYSFGIWDSFKNFF